MPRKVLVSKMALCGQVYKIKINCVEEREKISSIYAANGYPVWIEEQKVDMLRCDYYVCYMDQPEKENTSNSIDISKGPNAKNTIVSPHPRMG